MMMMKMVMISRRQWRGRGRCGSDRLDDAFGSSPLGRRSLDHDELVGFAANEEPMFEVISARRRHFDVLRSLVKAVHVKLANEAGEVLRFEVDLENAFLERRHARHDDVGAVAAPAYRVVEIGIFDEVPQFVDEALLFSSIVARYRFHGGECF